MSVELANVLVVVLSVSYVASIWVYSGVIRHWKRLYQDLKRDYRRLAEGVGSDLDESALHSMRLALRDLMDLPGAERVLAEHGLSEELQREMKGETSDAN